MDQRLREIHRRKDRLLGKEYMLVTDARLTGKERAEKASKDRSEYFAATPCDQTQKKSLEFRGMNKLKAVARIKFDTENDRILQAVRKRQNTTLNESFDTKKLLTATNRETQREKWVAEKDFIVQTSKAFSQMRRSMPFLDPKKEPFVGKIKMKFRERDQRKEVSPVDWNVHTKKVNKSYVSDTMRAKLAS